MTAALKKLLYREDRAARRERTRFEAWLEAQPEDTVKSVRAFLPIYMGRRSEKSTDWTWEDVRNHFAVQYGFPGTAHQVEEWSELAFTDGLVLEL